MLRLLYCLFLPFILNPPSEVKTQPLQWQIGYHKLENTPVEKWIAATVPGAVQLDVMAAENYKQPYWYADNFRQFDWMEDYFFTYKTTFTKPALQNGQRVFFHSKGIDYHFKILLNDAQIWEQEGMFTYVDLDLTDKLKEKNELQVIILPIPKLKGANTEGPLYRENARESAKPAVSYGWDWHPRLVTRGIWDETFLEIKNNQCINEARIDYELDKTLMNAKVTAVIEGVNLVGSSYRWTVVDPEGKTVIDKRGKLSAGQAKVDAQLGNISLWWPNGYGAANLYQSKFMLLDAKDKTVELKEGNIGFRKIRMVMNDGEWDRKIGFPATRNYAPASLEVNGKRIFAKGTNWVHPEIFVGKITPQRYAEQIRLAKNAHFNIFRVWGGGIVNKESFFNLCDKEGMLVWQEFPLACNDYPDSSRYLKVLEQEATSIVKRLKSHASLAIWSGGNELFNSWSGMTDQSLALRLLNSVCFRLDPKTPFIATSPLNGMGHGSYVFLDDKNEKGREVFQWMAHSNNTAYTEFGVSGTANVDVLKQFIPANELFPPKPGTAWETHHAFKVWREDSWLALPFLEEYFGKSDSLEELVTYSQLSQSEGLKFIYEEARRQKPYCSMALNWCYQEPWPSAANNSLLNWPNVIKPAYYQVANACRPVLASIRAPKFLWSEGEVFTSELFLLNDTYESLVGAKVKVKLIYDNNKVQDIASWDFAGSKEFENVSGPVCKINLPVMKNNLFYIKLEVEGKPEYDSRYTFLYKGKDVVKVQPLKDFIAD